MSSLTVTEQDSSNSLTYYSIVMSAHNKWLTNSVCSTLNPKCDLEGDILIVKYASPEKDMFSSISDEMEALLVCYKLAHTSEVHI